MLSVVLIFPVLNLESWLLLSSYNSFVYLTAWILVLYCSVSSLHSYLLPAGQIISNLYAFFTVSVSITKSLIYIAKNMKATIAIRHSKWQRRSIPEVSSHINAFFPSASSSSSSSSSLSPSPSPSPSPWGQL